MNKELPVTGRLHHTTNCKPPAAIDPVGPINRPECSPYLHLYMQKDLGGLASQVLDLCSTQHQLSQQTAKFKFRVAQQLRDMH